MSAGQSVPLRERAAWLWERSLDIVFPRRCVYCERFGAFLCKECSAGMRRAGGQRCEQCWMPEQRHAVCHRCRSRPPAFEAVRSVFIYEGAARDAVHALKFRGVSAIAPAMAALMSDCVSEWAPPAEVIVPVPLSGGRRRIRGYNQSDLLAQELSKLTGIPVDRRLLIRRRTTAAQVRQRDHDARRANVAGAFSVRGTVQGSVMLVDDVVTTGATLDACARALRDAGAVRVFALTFARED